MTARKIPAVRCVRIRTVVHPRIRVPLRRDDVHRALYAADVRAFAVFRAQRARRYIRGIALFVQLFDRRYVMAPGAHAHQVPLLVARRVLAVVRKAVFVLGFCAHLDLIAFFIDRERIVRAAVTVQRQCVIVLQGVTAALRHNAAVVQLRDPDVRLRYGRDDVHLRVFRRKIHVLLHACARHVVFEPHIPAEVDVAVDVEARIFRRRVADKFAARHRERAVRNIYRAARFICAVPLERPPVHVERAVLHINTGTAAARAVIPEYAVI